MLEVRETHTVDACLESLIAELAAVASVTLEQSAPLSTLMARIAKYHLLGDAEQTVSPFERMQHARDALTYLDTVGWKRSYHQRLFHEDFLVCRNTLYTL